MHDADLVKQRILLELKSRPASTLWKLANTLGLPVSEIEETLVGLADSGLVRVTASGWELTARGLEWLGRSAETPSPNKQPSKVGRPKEVVKIPLPSDVERSKKVRKPFKEEKD